MQPDDKPGRGRPTKYRPEYCERVKELGKLGKSIEQIACELDVGTRTIYEWRDVHPDFSRALDMAREFELHWWETVAQTHMIEDKDAPRLNASIWSRSMAARFPAKYRESTKQEITGPNGQPLISGIAVTFTES